VFLRGQHIKGLGGLPIFVEMSIFKCLMDIP
jgi:adenylyl- and sulfurtransferase ThiI